MSLISTIFRANRKFFPASTYFDNLYAEYKALDPPVPDVPPNDPNTPRKALEAIKDRRDNASLSREQKFSWDDVYQFELILLNYLPVDNLRNKVITLRAAYLNIFGEDKYRTYLETNPKDLSQITDVDKLRAEARFLLHQISLAFAALSSREGLGKWLTLWAAYLVVIAAVLTILLFMTNRILPGSPLKVAFAAGAIGGLLSILHRLQSIPSGGDPIFSLATFWHGAYALFVSPLTGAIFGILLYLIFAGGFIQGSVFPRIATPSGKGSGECGDLIVAQAGQPAATAPSPATSPAASGSPTPRSTVSPGPTASPTATAVTSAAASPAATASPTATATPAETASPSPAISPSPTVSPSPAAVNGSAPGGRVSPSPTGSPAPARTAASTASPSPSPSPSVSPTPAGSVHLNQFLKCSSPTTGIDYALLIIWCFLAGFAERLVPDTLNRLVDETDKTKVKKQ